MCLGCCGVLLLGCLQHPGHGSLYGQCVSRSRVSELQLHAVQVVATVTCDRQQATKQHAQDRVLPTLALQGWGAVMTETSFQLLLMMMMLALPGMTQSASAYAPALPLVNTSTCGVVTQRDTHAATCELLHDGKRSRRGSVCAVPC